MPAPHGVSSPAPRICMAGDPWPAPPPRLVNTAPSPLMVRMKPPTFSGLATRKPWSSGASPVAYAAALTQSSQAFPRAALPDDPADRGRGIVPDGFDSPPKRIGTRWPGARLGHGLRPARIQRPGPLPALASPVRQAFGAPFHPLWYPAASGAAARTRRRGGLRSSQTRSRRCRVPGETRPTPPAPASA